MKMRILIIGLDAATMDLIRPWAAAGHLPVIADLMCEGTHSVMLSTPNMHSASAWTAILTGLNPGRHGLYVFSDRDYATGRQVFFKGGDRHGDLITRHLAQQGLTSGLLNVPMTYPAECGTGGYMISGLDAPLLNANAFCPADLRDELFYKFPNYHFAPKNLGDLMKAGKIGAAIQAWLEVIETQTQVAEYLIRTRPTDFFMTVYTASDWGGHNLWKYFDETHPEYETASPYKDSLLDIYRALDSAIARLLKYTSKGTVVYIISDHGMGSHSGASYHLATWLEEQGFMTREKPVEARASLISTSRRAAKKILPSRLKEKLKSSIGDARLRQIQSADKDSFYSSIDWSRTVAYTEAGRHVININLAGRNKDGIVQPQDYTKTCDNLIAALSGWKDSYGVNVVERIVRRDEVYYGEFANRASDLYIYWNRVARMGNLPSEVKAKGFWWSGDHRPEGILICKGKGIRANCKLNEEMLPQVYDLLPTVMHFAGLPVPQGLDGRAVTELGADERAVRYADSSAGATTAEKTLTADEERLIEEKLRSLGYL